MNGGITTFPISIYYNQLYKKRKRQSEIQLDNKSDQAKLEYLENIHLKLVEVDTQVLNKILLPKIWNRAILLSYPYQRNPKTFFPNQLNGLIYINIFGGFKRTMSLILFYKCSSYKPQIDMRGRKQFHKGKSIHKDSYYTKQHKQSIEELASALISLENPIFQLYGGTPRFSSIHSKSKSARSISNNYRKGQQSKMVLNSGEVFPLRNQVICKLSYRQLSQEETSLFLTSFNFVSYLSLINIFGANNYCAKHEVAR